MKFFGIKCFIEMKFYFKVMLIKYGVIGNC